jgi:hypothetical protein
MQVKVSARVSVGAHRGRSRDERRPHSARAARRRGRR